MAARGKPERFGVCEAVPRTKVSWGPTTARRVIKGESNCVVIRAAVRDLQERTLRFANLLSIATNLGATTARRMQHLERRLELANKRIDSLEDAHDQLWRMMHNKAREQKNDD